ncbi:MAG TPA: NapC/NirT family cytochrome c [Woeseiaceae bacterium]|jgi:cytochrome c-type protein NapC|nr:NapC/NirT family cytochrome c [Woeseiaceae bacterium]
MTDRQRGFWRKLWTIPRRRWLLGIPAGGYLMIAGGIVIWGGFNTALELSNTETFCTSCHEMRDNVFAEYQKTIHYSNRTGVRATCPDCHVPKAWPAKILKKARATTNELPHWILGTIDTREKFQAKRLELATDEWNRFKSNDSLECRNCHELEHMDLTVQGRSASRKHIPARVRERGETCIDCHQGIAHELPDGWEDIPLWADN